MVPAEHSTGYFIASQSGRQVGTAFPKPFSIQDTSKSDELFWLKGILSPCLWKQLGLWQKAGGKCIFIITWQGIFEENQERSQRQQIKSMSESCTCWFLLCQVLMFCVKVERGQRFSSHIACLSEGRETRTDWLAAVWSFFYIPYSTWRVFIPTGASVTSHVWGGSSILCTEK